MKRLISLCTTFILLISLCACGKSSPASTETTQAVPAPAEASTATETTASTPKETTAPQPTTDSTMQIVQTDEYTLVPCNKYSLSSRNFTDGVAWATMRDLGTNEERIGLINESGEVIYFVDKERFALTNSSIQGIITSPFINGLSCIYPYGGGNANNSLPGFIIINQHGDEVYTCFDENVYMCGQASDGNFILLKHESGFSSNGWFFYILDSSLNLTETGIEGNNTGSDISQSVGLKTISDGLYLIHYYFLCLESGSRYMADSLYDADYAYSGHSSDYVCFRFPYLSSSHYLVPISELKTVTSETELQNLMRANPEWMKFEGSDNVFNNYSFNTWNRGIAYDFGTRQYCNIDTGVTITYPTFPDTVKYFRVDRFRGGYAALYLIGADGDGYVTLIDTDGNILYDPVSCQGFSVNSYEVGATSYNGYIFCSYHDNSDSTVHMQIFDRSGQQKKIGDNLSELAGLFIYYDDSFAINIGEDYIWVSGAAFGQNTYVSLDGTRTIGTVTASYNTAGDLVYTGKDG